MQPPRQLIPRSAIRHARRFWLVVYGLLNLPVLLAVASIPTNAQDAPRPSSPSTLLDAALARPLSSETWPLWREAYVRIFFDDDQDAEKEKSFHEQVRRFFRGTASVTDGSLPKEFEADPMAWVAMSWTHMYLAGEATTRPSQEKYYTRAEAASRKGIALGDPLAIASYALAVAYVYHNLWTRDPGKPLTGEAERQLREAEDRLRHVEQVSPRANVDLWHGRIAQLRGDSKKAADLFGRAVEKHPMSARAAAAFLSSSKSAVDVPGKLADRTGPFALRFPNDPEILALHAMALYRDERYAEAANTLQRARGLDERVTRMLGDQGVKAIEEGRQLTSDVVTGLKALEAKQFEAAAAAFRRALVKAPGNPLAARLLSRALASRVASTPRATPQLISSTESEIRALVKRLPDDPEIQADLATMLSMGGHNIEAADTLQRLKKLGGRPEKFFDSWSLLAIQKGAESDRSARFWVRTAVAAVAVAVLWIGIMFAMGALLAICIPRIPRSLSLTSHGRSGREVWLERFYLLVLSLGLVIFYASVPVVAAGLLAVSLALFGLLLAVRVLHFGVLHRGLWAFWNVIRCTLIGPRGDVLGIEATSEAHPRLFESLKVVADRLQTRPVDMVYLTPSSNISVNQEGSGPFGLLGKRRRVLQIGISTLPLLSREEFQSILAHEYGHFSHNDTLYSRFIFQVSASLATSLAVMSAAGGFMNYVNPFYGFWWLYLRAYTLLANGFSRSREFLADRQAVAAYGKQAFISGLTKVSVDGVLFESSVYASIRHLLSQGKAFTNAFDAFRQFREGTEIVESRGKMLDELRRTKPRWLDTHPTFSERLAAVAGFPDSAPTGDSEPAIELLSEPLAVEAKLTDLLTTYIFENLSRMSSHNAGTAGAEED